MKKLLFIIMFILLSFQIAFADRIPVPSGSIRWDNFRDNYFNVQTGELYNFLGADESGELPAQPTFDSLIISGTGNSWIELGNNTSFSDSLVGKYGLRFYNGALQKIINGTASAITSGGINITEGATTADPSSMAEGDIYVETDTGTTTIKTALGSVEIAGTYTADPTAPVLSSATLGTNGTTLTLVFDQAVSHGSGYTLDDFNVDASVTGSDIAMTYASGDTTGTHVMTLASTVNSGETVDFDFLGTSNCMENGTGDDLAAIVSAAVTNNSTQGAVNPDVLYECEDNAASTTVLATYGSNGSLIDVNTADNTSTTNCGGTRSFSPAAATTRIVSGALTEASLDDGDFTIQFDYYADATTGFGAGNYVRLVKESNTGSAIMFRSNNGSSTSFLLQIGGVEYTITLDEINTGACQEIRIVVDADGTNKVVVYQGPEGGPLVAKYTRTDSITTPDFPATPTITFGASGDANQGISLRNGKLDDIKIWYGVELP